MKTSPSLPRCINSQQTTLNTLDSNTTGTVNADTVNTLSGAAADLNTAYDSDGISNLGDEEITLSDASTPTASAISHHPL